MAVGVEAVEEVLEAGEEEAGVEIRSRSSAG